MHWACWIAASAIGTCAGYMLHSARMRMLTGKERAEMERLKAKLRETLATVEAVHDLIVKRDAELQKTRLNIVPRPPQSTPS